MRTIRGNVEPGTEVPRRRRRVAFGAVLGAAAMLAAACGSSSTTSSHSNSSSGSHSSGSGTAAVAGLYGKLPPAGGTPTNGGTVTVGQITGSTPTYIFPMTPSNLASVYNDFIFQNIMWEPLYWSPQGANVQVDNALSIANPPTFTDGNKTVTFTLKSYKWSNGAPVTANDVIFFIDLVKAALKESVANWNNYTPGFLPDNLVSYKALNSTTVQLKLTKAYNPQFFYDNQLGLLYALPSTDWNVDSANGPHLTDWSNPAVAAKIYNYLNAESKKQSDWASNPLWKDVDGPYYLSSFNPTNGSYTQTINKSYSGPMAHITTIDAVTYTSNQALFSALRSGTLDFAGYNGEIDPSEIPQLPSIEGNYSVFGLPDFGFQAAFINFENTTNAWDKVVGQLYIRQALAYLEDQPAWVKSRGLIDGAGAVDYGPIPASPPSPFAPANATMNPYPFSIAKAVSLLKSHGWDVKPGGVDTCANPGSGANQCGAGIPKGTPLSISWQYANTPPLTQAISEAYASNCAQAGIHLVLKSETFNTLINNDSDPSAPSKKNTWEIVDFGGFTQSLYPTTLNLFNTGGTFNLGGYNSPEANTLINNSVYGNSASAVSKEASYLGENLPVLWMPNGSNLTAVKDTLGGTEDSFLTTTQDVFTPQYWYIKKA